MNVTDRILRKIGARLKKYHKKEPCTACHGAGSKSNSYGYSTPCLACGGTGTVNAEIRGN